MSMIICIYIYIFCEDGNLFDFFFFSKKIDYESNFKFDSVRLSSIKLSWLKLSIPEIRIGELLFLVLLRIIFNSYNFRDMLLDD